MSKWKTVEDFERELLRDRAFRRDFEELEPEYRIAREILAARQAIGMSQQALARAIGTSQSRISQWERGEELPRLDNLQKVADATGVSLNISVEPTGQGPAAGGGTQRTGRGGTSSMAHGSKVRKASGRKATGRKAAGRKRTSGRKATGRRKTAGRRISATRKSTARRTAVRKATGRKATGRKKIATRKKSAGRRKSASRKATG
jgi:transcriptional regulator with XRE-family HTH domain